MPSSLTAALHAATHRVPGIPEHRELPAGHQGRARRATPRSWHHPSRRNHQARPPRVLAGWQRRIAALFGQQLP